jgi:hypothetical protein
MASVYDLITADCDTDHHLVVAKVREKLSVSKAATQHFDMERSDLKKLNHTAIEELLNKLESQTDF